MAILVPLERLRPCYGSEQRIQCSRSLPFIESGKGWYTHRVRSLALYNCCEKGHFAAHTWCGISLCFDGKPRRGGGGKSRIVAEPSDGYVICATCEGRAIGAGQLGAKEIAGHPVIFSPRRFTQKTAQSVDT